MRATRKDFENTATIIAAARRVFANSGLRYDDGDYADPVTILENMERAFVIYYAQQHTFDPKRFLDACHGLHKSEHRNYNTPTVSDPYYHDRGYTDGLEAYDDGVEEP